MPATEGPPTTADRSLLLCLRAWGDGAGDARLRSRIAPAWADRLPAGDEAGTPEMARLMLLRDHAASARPDPTRVHPSWYARALTPESRAVRGTVVAHAPAAIREALGRDETDPVAEFPADPDALGWALALWSERLVGDAPPRPDDPMVVVALTQLGPRARARLAKVAGQAKHAFAMRGHGPDATDEAAARMTPIDRVRLAYFRRLIGVADPRLVPLARTDLAGACGDPRRAHARLGLVTLGRLLAGVEPHRARWALQHLPYSLARLARPGPAPGFSPRALIAWERWVLEAAWARLISEGRLPAPPPPPDAAGGSA
ncbi:hypothetical protein TA3x_005515 [Tundrisphaera sp. TA3]|uniref:hypothetical protein n=1 Tax=Tundrisphaera sp. TA3 TaxID=3435775 RepID=UPI003EB86664